MPDEILRAQLKPIKIIINDTEDVDIGAKPEAQYCLYVDEENVSSLFHTFKEAALSLSKKENGGLYVESNLHEIL